MYEYCPVCNEQGLSTILHVGMCWRHGLQPNPLPHFVKEGNLMVKKYYAGAKHIGAAIKRGTNADCTRDSIEEAIEDAKRMVNNGEVEVAVVVEIRAIVRKEFPPIVVERV